VIPVLTPDEMRAADAAALVALGPGRESVLIERAGHAVAGAAMAMMGGAYGRRVTVLAGPGHNGDDGRAAARRLGDRGARVRVLDPGSCRDLFIDPRDADLVIDGAFGIGFRGEWNPPMVIGVPVLAVDLPSGLDACTGAAGALVPADRTVTFAAPKVGMFLGDGPEACGTVEVADIGVPVDETGAGVYLVEDADVAAWLPVRQRDEHKWSNALRVVAGSEGMLGASALVSAAAMRAGAGIVHLSWRGSGAHPALPTEVVGRPLPAGDWAATITADLDRFHALVVGPGLGRGDDTAASLRRLLADADLPVVVDGDGLADAVDPHGTHDTLRGRTAPTVLTPHDGEFAMLGGDAMDSDRIGATRALAVRTGCTVLRKGPVTIVADPGGACYIVVAGDARLATAGTGDVLAGMIGALLARGMAPAEAAAAAAHLHGRAAASCPREGTIARDVVARIPDAIEEVLSHVG
jgi:hydroxyethylthiazole kinase-like uncharacterized protein yjeF